MNKLAVTFAGGAFLVASGAVNAVVIDNFNTGVGINQLGPIPQPTVGQNASFTTPSPAEGTNDNILGGQRAVYTEVTQTGTNAQNTTIINGGLLDVANSSTMDADVVITWDNFTDVDLTANGVTGFFLGLPAPINNELSIKFDVTDGVTTVTFTRTFANGASGADFFFPFASFGNSSVFASADSIVMTLFSFAGWDAQIDLVETRPRPPSDVPAPGTLVLLGAGLVGFAARRQLKRG